MGTEKRERQKANRSLKQQQELRTERNRALRKRGIKITLIAVAALAAVVFIAWMGGAFDDGGDGAISSPATTVGDATDPGATTPPPEPTECPDPDRSGEPRLQFSSPPPMCIDPTATYVAEVTTNFGDYTIALDTERAPEAVNNFVVLARYGYFNDTICHRVIPGFMSQCGDPTGTGTGGPGYQFDAELPEAGEYQLGSVAMANASDPNTQGSQFFVVAGEAGEALPPDYTLFGQVIEGLETIAAIDAVGNPQSNGVPPLEEVRIARVAIIES